MWLKRVFRVERNAPDPDVLNEARASMDPLLILRDSAGWALVQRDLETLAMGLTQEWMAGVEERRSIELYSAVRTLGFVINLVDTKIELYRKILMGEEEEGKDPDLEGTTPMTSPYENLGQP